MPQTVADIMTPDPVTVDVSCTSAEAARRMAATDTNSVLVVRNGVVTGILTDRDIAIQLVARDKSPATLVSDIVPDCQIVIVSSDTTITEALRLIRRSAVRCLPVVDDGRAVGMLCLGDVAIQRSGLAT